ncbi:MAG TPA: hypothetical protein VK420_14985, partial [Longimicrobium sp.]|nr:hypothetical protein [Longimicrobium sp.]
MPVPAIELRPRGPVALLDAAINLCAQDAGLWSLGLTGGALVTAAVWNVTEALRRGEGLALPTLLLALAWFARGIFQGAACHYVERLVLDPTPPSTWASLRAALGRAPTLFAAVATAFAINTVGIVATLGLVFILVNAHLAVYGAAMRGVGSPLGLYRTSARLLGKAAAGGLMWIRLAFWAQLLLALNLHMAVGTLIYLGRKLVALDLTFVDRYASIDNPVWLFTLATVTFAITEPLRASVAALLLIDGRVRQEGLDLVAGLEQLPRRQRPGGKPLTSRASNAGAAVLVLLVSAL